MRRITSFFIITLCVNLCFGQIKPHVVGIEPMPAGYDPVDAGRRVVQDFLSRPHMLTPQDTTIHYAEVCAWYGGLTFSKLAKDKQLQKALIDKYDPLLDQSNPILPRKQHVDYNVFGIVPLEIYIQTGKKQFLKIGLDKADSQWEDPLSNGMSRQTRYWIDDMYMISSLQAQAFRATGKKVYLERAALQMVPYLDSLQQKNGLFFHGSKGRFHWGRGNGWMAAGMTELLKELPPDNPNYARIMSGYQIMMRALLENQDSNGMWHQLVDYPEAWPETSCTGMFTYALITGVKNGWLDKDKYEPAMRKAWMALVDNLDSDGKMKNVCAGMGQRTSAESYMSARRALGDYHGQAPLLWCATALLK